MNVVRVFGFSPAFGYVSTEVTLQKPAQVIPLSILVLSPLLMRLFMQQQYSQAIFVASDSHFKKRPEVTYYEKNCIENGFRSVLNYV